MLAELWTNQAFIAFLAGCLTTIVVKGVAWLLERHIHPTWCMYCNQIQPSTDMHWTEIGLYQCGVCITRDKAKPMLQAKMNEMQRQYDELMHPVVHRSVYAISIETGRK